MLRGELTLQPTEISVKPSRTTTADAIFPHSLEGALLDVFIVGQPSEIKTSQIDGWLSSVDKGRMRTIRTCNDRYSSEFSSFDIIQRPRKRFRYPVFY